MTSDDHEDRVSLAQRLMVEITTRLEDLALMAAEQQRARCTNPALQEGLSAVQELAKAHLHLLSCPTPAESQS